MALRRRMLWYLKGFVCLCCRCQSEAASADPARALSCGSCGKKMGWQYLSGSGSHDFACLHCGAHASDEETKNEKTWHGVHYFKLQIEILLCIFFTRLLQSFPYSLKMYIFQWLCINPNPQIKLRIWSFFIPFTTLSSLKGGGCFGTRLLVTIVPNKLPGRCSWQMSPTKRLLVKLVGKQTLNDSTGMSCLTWELKFDLPYSKKGKHTDFSGDSQFHCGFIWFSLVGEVILCSTGCFVRSLDWADTGTKRLGWSSNTGSLG